MISGEAKQTPLVMELEGPEETDNAVESREGIEGGGGVGRQAQAWAVTVSSDYSFSFRFCLYLFVYPLYYVLFVFRTFSLITPLPVIYPSIGSSHLVPGLCKAVYLPSKAVLTTSVLLSRCSALPLPYTDKQQ